MYLTFAAVSFAVAVLFGISMALRHFSGQTPGALLARSHGVFVFAGFAALFAAAWPSFAGRPAWALGGFAIASVGGSAMLLGWRGRPLPSALVLIHGGVALIAFAILLSMFF